jgi:MarR family transcriptional regulator, organic hydroperoxide resistance regulator
MSNHLRLENQLCFAIHAASRAMTGAYQPLLDELGITYPQYLVLLLLWEQDGVRVSQLGERLHLDSGTLTPLLKRLESHGVVERRRSSADERVVEVFLTTAGKKLKRRAADVPAAMLCRTGLSIPELEKLRGTLQDLTRKLQAAEGE